jgi:serine/threonine protein kinase
MHTLIGCFLIFND